MDPLTSLVIVRSEWLTPVQSHGEGWNLSMLRNATGLKCCLAFALKAYGCSDEQLTWKMMPAAVGEFPLFSEKRSLAQGTGFEITNTEFSVDAAEINDDRTIPNAEREERLTSLFQKNGIALTFVD
jgi:hypothetical protein